MLGIRASQVVTAGPGGDSALLAFAVRRTTVAGSASGMGSRPSATSAFEVGGTAAAVSLRRLHPRRSGPSAPRSIPPRERSGLHQPIKSVEWREGSGYDDVVGLMMIFGAGSNDLDASAESQLFDGLGQEGAASKQRLNQRDLQVRS